MITDVTNIASQLLTYDPAQCWPVSKFTMSILPEAKPTINCFQALDYLYATIRVFLRLFDSHAVTDYSQTGRAHLLLISNTPGIAGGAIGVITLEGTLQCNYSA